VVKTAKEKAPPAADDLVREAAGSYVSGDGRFEVRQSDANWYVVDREQANEFGQELIHGPYESMKEAKASMPGARDVKPMLRTTKRPKKTPEKPPAPKPQSWIDKLPRSEAVEVRALIRALERQGVDDAEALVRKDRQGLLPTVALALLQRRLDDLIDDMPEKERPIARKALKRFGDVISGTEKPPEPLPGWALFETGAGREPTKRRMRLEG
jgi:hypothetical protein